MILNMSNLFIRKAGNMLCIFILVTEKLTEALLTYTSKGINDSSFIEHISKGANYVNSTSYFYLPLFPSK